jgi:hypothetical protein
VSLQQQGLTKANGNTAVMLSGIGMTIIGAVPPLNRFLTRVSKITII